MRKKLGLNNKGISLIEALVSIVVLTVGVASILQLSVYAIRTADVTLEKTKVNFLSEMMMETLVVNQSALQSYQLSINDCNYTYNNNLQKIWIETYRNVLDTNTKTTRCLPGDKKLIRISNNTNASINFIIGGGKQNKFLGFSKIE
jgi:Tfp pilus assembly protein PilV